jgi:hypothetical protein
LNYPKQITLGGALGFREMTAGNHIPHGLQDIYSLTGNSVRADNKIATKSAMILPVFMQTDEGAYA